MSRVGRETMAIVGGDPNGIFLYVEAGEGWVGPSLYREEIDVVRYYEPTSFLSDALFDLWYAEDQDKHWTEMHYAIESGIFNAKFEFDDMRLPDDGSIDRRERVLHARYGDKPIVYPPAPLGMMPYQPEP